MRVLRYDVPVDGKSHDFDCTDPLHVDCREVDVVTFWALDSQLLVRRTFQVFGTGEQILSAQDWHYRGTALSPAQAGASYGHLVWHLFESVGP